MRIRLGHFIKHMVGTQISSQFQPKLSHPLLTSISQQQISSSPYSMLTCNINKSWGKLKFQNFVHQKITTPLIPIHHKHLTCNHKYQTHKHFRASSERREKKTKIKERTRRREERGFYLETLKKNG